MCNNLDRVANTFINDLSQLSSILMGLLKLALCAVQNKSTFAYLLKHFCWPFLADVLIKYGHWKLRDYGSKE